MSRRPSACWHCPEEGSDCRNLRRGRRSAVVQGFRVKRILPILLVLLFSLGFTPVVGSTLELLVFYLLLCQFIPRFEALLGTLLLAISPWHFHLSRVSMDA